MDQHDVVVKTVTMTDGTRRVRLESPFHPEMSARARSLGGTWQAGRKVWYFDVRDEDRVRDLAVELYGMDGSEPVARVDLRVDLDALGLRWQSEYWLAGRCIARRAERDWRVRLGDGVVLVAGGFPTSGGSRKSPALMPGPGTVLEVRDVPRPLAEQEMATHPDAVRPAGERDGGEGPAAASETVLGGLVAPTMGG